MCAVAGAKERAVSALLEGNVEALGKALLINGLSTEGPTVEGRLCIQEGSRCDMCLLPWLRADCGLT